MPFPFTLPTTSHLSFQTYLNSPSHPSLPITATTSRNLVRAALKKHKRLPPVSQPANLHVVLSALTDYLPYLFALDNGLSSNPVSGEEIHITLSREIQVEWRPVLLAPALPGREPPRIKGLGLDFELAFTLTTLAYVHVLLARQKLHATLYSATTPSPDQRTAAITGATKHLLTSASIHAYLTSRSSGGGGASSAALDIANSTQQALSSIALAEATLLAVLKDDAYVAAMAQERNKNDKEWMIKAPEVPRVRAHLFARLCLRAGELAGLASGALVNVGGRARGKGEDGNATGGSGSSSGAGGKLDPAFVKYVDDLRKVSRAKACRFFGVDRDLAGETGEGIAWLRGGKVELGVAGAKDGEKVGGLAKFRKEWAEKREDKKIEKGVEWGADAGRAEEIRVLEMLEKKWEKMNDMINTQLIPASEPLLASMPSGRDMHATKPYVAPNLDEAVLMQMRAPPDEDDLQEGLESSGDEFDDRDPVGAFPGTKGAYANEEGYY